MPERLVLTFGKSIKTKLKIRFYLKISARMLALVVMNLSGSKQPYQLWIGNKAAETINLPHAISTFVVE